MQMHVHVCMRACVHICSVLVCIYTHTGALAHVPVCERMSVRV
jgi:hypothetical protein